MESWVRLTQRWSQRRLRGACLHRRRCYLQGRVSWIQYEQLGL